MELGKEVQEGHCWEGVGAVISNRWEGVFEYQPEGSPGERQGAPVEGLSRLSRGPEGARAGRL